MRDPLGVLTDADHRLAEAGEVTHDQLRGVRLVLPEPAREPDLYAFLADEVLGDLVPAPSVVLESCGLESDELSEQHHGPRGPSVAARAEQNGAPGLLSWKRRPERRRKPPSEADREQRPRGRWSMERACIADHRRHWTLLALDDIG